MGKNVERSEPQLRLVVQKGLLLISQQKFILLFVLFQKLNRFRPCPQYQSALEERVPVHILVDLQLDFYLPLHFAYSGYALF